MIYYEMSAPSRFGGSLKGVTILQQDIGSAYNRGERFAVAIFPEQDSGSWYFLAPDGRVWINGLDGVQTAEECIVLFNSLDEAKASLEHQVIVFKNSVRWAIFSAENDEDGDLRLKLYEERREE